MNKKLIAFTIVLVLLPSLVACTSLPVAGLTGIFQTGITSLSNSSIENKLGFGILKLEGTSQEITSSQADTLLPLWRAVNKMGNDKTAAQEEVAALYTQIQENLTSEQVAAIETLNYDQQDLSTLMTQYSLVDNSQSSQTSSTSTSSTNNAAAGMSPDMGGGGDPMMGDIMGGDLGGGTSGSQTSSSQEKSSGNNTTNYNTIFASTIVDLLKTKVSEN